MDPNRKTSPALFLLVILAFIVGVVIGLVVLGWGLWPVEWTGASIANMNASEQQDFLRAAIDSYSYNSDITIAQQRYNALGDQKEKILSDILANPGTMEKSDVEKFAEALKAQPASISTTVGATVVSPTAQVKESNKTPIGSLLVNRPYWMNICLAAGAVLAGIVLLLLIILLLRRRRKVKSGDQPAQDFEPADFGSFDGSTQEQQPAQVASDYALPYTDTHMDPTLPVQNDLPDWFRDAGKEDQQVPAETNIGEPDLELSESDIHEITSSDLSSLESKPVYTPASQEYDQSQAEAISVPSGSVEQYANLVETPPPPGDAEVPSGERPVMESFEETQAETIAKFSREIELAPGIDPADAQKLRNIGITAPLLLLKKGTSAQGRQSIAAELGTDEQQVLKWVNSIDLLRIKGLQIEDARMLVSSGVDLLVELATRDPEKLLDKLDLTAKLMDPAYKVPSLARIQNWISQAKELPRIISNS